MAELPKDKTEALYQKNGSLTTHNSTVSYIERLSSLPQETQSLFKPPANDSEPFVITMPSTIFHAQGGGQPSDTGTLTLEKSTSPTFHVHQVRKPPTTPSILHLGTFSPSEPSQSDSFAPCISVTQTIDTEKRLLHSRLHTAGHALGLAIYLLSRSGKLPSDLKDGKASHYPGSAFVEFSGLIPGDAKSAIQAQVDDLVAQDLPVDIHFWSKEDANEKCITGIEGAAVDDVGDEGVRVVDIGGLGSYPCGGTHVGTLKGCGRVVVRGIKRQKGVSKVSYEVAES